ncbi:MAG: hypothetical protein WC716_02910 [Chitinophagaceae bacterium]|jgi:hypothetical protein
MEQLTLNEDIKVYCETASSFPDGVKSAHEKLHSLIEFSTERKYFGLSRPNENGVIMYKAAAEELKLGELSTHALEEIIIQKGNYQCIVVHHYMKDIPAIGLAFQELIALPDIDPQGYCIEWYINDEDVRCMVRLKS